MNFASWISVIEPANFRQMVAEGTAWATSCWTRCMTHNTYTSHMTQFEKSRASISTTALEMAND
jgi:hypothetical protein